MEHIHIVSRYDKNLERIKARILEMGEEVISQLAKATAALDDFSAEDVEQVIADDRRINGMNKNIYILSEQLIALRQPMANDLRQALSPISIAGDLERIGDHAKATAKRARILAREVHDPGLLAPVHKMSFAVRAMLRDVLRAYTDNDTELAAEIRHRDQAIDLLNKEVLKAAVQAISEAPERAEVCVNVILLARGFERVGDHVVNIARSVHQIATGEDIKASD